MTSKRDEKWEEWNRDVVIAFEKPNILKGPDVNDVLDEYGNVQESWLTGCRTCQLVKSQCKCVQPKL